MKLTAFRFLLCAFVATALSLNAAAQTAVGQIKVAMITGDVSKLSTDGTTTALANGDVVTESDTISTGNNSGVVLVFMNGSTVKLGSDTRLAIDEFKMDPLEQDITNVSALTAEPTQSKTTLNLSYGEMVGDVKKLNASSTYSIKTPVGAAGIRGTIYRIVYRPTADGKAFFTVSTAEGLVVMTGVTTIDVPIDAGQEVVVEIDTANPTTPTIVTQDIPAATTTAINTATTEITQVLQTSTISNPTPPTPPTPPTTPPPPPPDPTPPQPKLTPGAG